MSQDARRALAFVAKRQGVDVMAAAMWANVISLELGWLSPSAARRFVEGCQSAGLLMDSDDGLALSFPRREVDVPRGFRLSPDALPPEAGDEPAPNRAVPDPFLELVDRIGAATGGDRAKVLAQIQKVQDTFGGKLEAEAAAIRVAVGVELDVSAEAKQALDRLKARA